MAAPSDPATAPPPPRRPVRFGALLLRDYGITVAAVMITLGGFTCLGVGWLAAELADDLGERAVDLVQARTYQYMDDAGTAIRVLSGLQQDDAGRGVAGNHEPLWRLLRSGLGDARSMEALFVADRSGSLAGVRRDPVLATGLIDRRAPAARETWILRDAQYRETGRESRGAPLDPRTRPWFARTGTERLAYWSEVSVSPTSGQPAVTVTYPLLDREGRVARVTGASVPLERLARFVVQSLPTASSIVILVSGEDEVLANAVGGLARPVMREGRLLRTHEVGIAGLAEAVRAARAGGATRAAATLGGQSYRVHVKPFGGYDWTAAVLIPDSDALGQLRSLLVVALLVIVSVLLAAVIALLRLSRSLGQPLARLADDAGRIRRFELDEFEGARSRILEVSQLSGALRSAVDALKGFKRYVPADLVRQILASPDFARVGGREAELPVMFTDIVGFTSIAEKLPPAELLAQVSEYLEVMTGSIMRHHGTVDKYIGDAVMAFWGAPQPVENGPALACRAALECQARLADLNARWEREGRPPLVTGIGINVARVVVGNFGSSDRLNYSLLGDGVNVAARLEELNRRYGTRILISEAALAKIGDAFEVREIDRVVVKGRSAAIRVFELLREKAPASGSGPSAPGRDEVRGREAAPVPARHGRTWSQTARAALSFA